MGVTGGEKVGMGKEERGRRGKRKENSCWKEKEEGGERQQR